MSRNPLRAAAFLSIGLLALPAAAQGIADKLQKGPIVSGTGERRPTRNTPPPGLPGAAIGQDRVTPSDHIAGDLPPTDALFDSINRGDIVSARDALARGADFNARNILGLTPLDQSIDLGRNDITFLLLSLRGSAPTPDLNPPAKDAKATKTAAAEKKPAPSPAPSPRPIVPAPPRPVAQAQPTRGGDPGTPNPSSGFLGFGG